jgi:hypothetical protein
MLVVGSPPTNVLAILARTRSKGNALGRRCPILRFQLKHKRHAAEIRRPIYPPVRKSSASVAMPRMKTYSGKVIFCRFVKKSLLRIVEAESMLPDRLVTTLVTSSGSAMPSARSTRFSGFKASMPSASNSFSKVFITGKIHKHTKNLTLETRNLPGKLFTKASKV